MTGSAIAFWAAPLGAQVCLGTPLMRAASLEMGVEFGRGYAASDGFTADLTLVPRRGVAVEGGYRLMMSDTLFNAGNEAYGRVSVQRSVAGVSICPVAGARRALYSEPTRIMNEQGQVLELDERRSAVVQVPIGVGIGRSVPVVGSLSLIPSVYLGRTWQKTVAIERDRREISVSRWVRSAGITASFDQLYIRASATSITRRDHKPEFSVHLGMLTP